MICQQRDTTWPFLCILLALFVLSAVSPRAWERLARREAAAEATVPEPAADAQDAIAIPPGALHQITNTGSEALKFLCCCAPGYEHEDTVLV